VRFDVRLVDLQIAIWTDSRATSRDALWLASRKSPRSVRSLPRSLSRMLWLGALRGSAACESSAPLIATSASPTPATSAHAARATATCRNMPDRVSIIISSPRCSPRQPKSYAPAAWLKRSSHDSLGSSMGPRPGHLLAPTDAAELTNSITAPISVVNALVTKLTIVNPSRALGHLAELDRVFQRTGIASK